MNRRVSQSRTIGRRTRKIEPYSTNAKALNPSLTPSSSRRTTNPRRLPPREQHQPRKEEDGPTAHYVYPTTGRQPRDEEDRPKAHCVNQPKGTSTGRGRQATGNCVYQPPGVPDTAGTGPARNQAIQRECQGSGPSSDPQQQQQCRPVHKREKHKNIIVQ